MLLTQSMPRRPFGCDEKFDIYVRVHFMNTECEYCIKEELERGITYAVHASAPFSFACAARFDEALPTSRRRVLNTKKFSH